jgi:mono/diheme cytochrome c family protein
MPGQQSKRRPRRLRVRLFLSSILYPLSSLCLLAGCDRDDKFEIDMRDQPRQDTYDRSPFFSDGASARPLVPGTVARAEGYADRMSQPGGGMGNLAGEPFPADFPTGGPALQARLQRGQERYEIFCAVCHGVTGDGDGMIVQRGFSPPPPFVPHEQDKVTNPQRYARSQHMLVARPSHFYGAITNGFGAMYSYGERVSPDDRWAVVAYVRVLQQAKLSGAGRPARMPTTLPAVGDTPRPPAAELPPGGTKRVQ